MRIKILLATAALAVAAAAVVAPVAPASADPLPLGTFRIQDTNGNCADAFLDASESHTVYLDPCNLLNLDEQFTYDPLNQQILSVGRLGYCLQDNFNEVTWRPCDTTNVNQTFQRYQSGTTGRYYIISTYNLIRSCLQGDAVALNAQTPCKGFPTGAEYLFTFPLV